MLISLDWIKEFTNLPDMNADDLANSFTMTTAEVEEVKTTFKHLELIKVAQIESIRKHPEADKLNLVTINYGDSTKEVVCGAGNVKEGLKIPYAPLGVTLPNGLTLEPKKIRGVLSEGMLCSADELGHGEVSDGLLELKDDAVVGTAMIDYFGLTADVILDVDNKSLTHRPDLWGHYGLAREFAACYENELKNPFDNSFVKNIEDKFSDADAPIKVKVDKDSSCKAYYGICLDGVTVKESSAKVKARLEAVGLRPINNIVDISNYVMLELGIPLHIFDRSTIEGNIHIKCAKESEKFTTLDEMNRKLIATDTVIADDKKSLVLAGVMGGLNSGVTDSTKNIFIEVANFEADRVRKTSTRLGLRTDSSSRYEKSLDSKALYTTMLRTIDLVLKECPEAKVIGKPQYDGDDLSKIENLKIDTSTNKIETTLGHTVGTQKLTSIFKSLDFGVEVNNGEFKLTIPTFRTTKDIENEADIIEEVGRMIGYDNINPISPKSDIQTTRLSPAKVLHRKISDFMVYRANALETMTYPLIGEKLLEKANWTFMNEDLVLVNAISQDADRMRPSLVPHALNTVAVNAKNYDSFKFFELGRSYLPCDKNFSAERSQLIIGSFSKSKTTFIETINDVKKLLNSLNISFDISEKNPKFKNALIDDQWSGVHPHEYLNVRVMGKFNGVITSVHPLMLRNFKVKGNLTLAVIDFTDFQNRQIKSKTKYVPISKYPVSTFDCTVIADSDAKAGVVLDTLKKLKVKELSSRKIVDIFNMEDGTKAITIRVTFEDPNKTLDPALIKDSEQKVVATLEAGGYPLKK
ncbi:MAG: phenylalanine--tRNA ligase subunit beta [Bacteriovoracaceae bacterium]|jgi:phenylalanyl-tRNA synthetase beta chain|nr:phenylalanine--tRNA ligase subunit beta [Bacteriovoracaceae bacterium]